MVDTKDLKSFGHCGCAGSSPASSTGVKLCKSMIYGAFRFSAFSKEELSFGIKLSNISYELCGSCKPRVKPENV